MPYPDKLEPEGPLPLGWHRITWTQTGYLPGYGARVVYSNDGATPILLRVALEASTAVVPDSVTTQAWNEYPSGLRSCPCDNDDCPDH